MLALSSLVRSALFQGSLERADVAALFPGMLARPILLHPVAGVSCNQLIDVPLLAIRS